MTTLRTGLVAIGTVTAVYGVFVLLTRQDGDRVLDAVGWLVAGVVLHDAVLVPATIAVTALGLLLVPAPWWRPAAVALVVVGPLTLLAIPVLGRFGALPDDPGLLERPYLASWLGVVAATMMVVAAVGLRTRRGRGEESDGPRIGGR